jgi:cytochrome P450
MQKLLSLPLLSSVFTETLRRISTTPTRRLLNDLVVDGYVLKAGNSVMVPSWLAHTDEEWSSEGHPATSFWPERFLRQRDSVNEKKKSISTSAPSPGKYFLSEVGAQCVLDGSSRSRRS